MSESVAVNGTLHGRFGFRLKEHTTNSVQKTDIERYEEKFCMEGYYQERSGKSRDLLFVAFTLMKGEKA